MSVSYLRGLTGRDEDQLHTRTQNHKMPNSNKFIQQFKTLVESIIPLDVDDLEIVVRIQNSNEASKLRNFITFTIRPEDQTCDIRLNRWEKGKTVQKVLLDSNCSKIKSKNI